MLLAQATGAPAVLLPTSPPIPPSLRFQAGQQDPDIFFTARPRQGTGLGQRNREYISFWADEEPVLWGRTPVQVIGGEGRPLP